MPERERLRVRGLRVPALAAVLFLAVLGMFWKVGGFGFTRDDSSYLIQNPDLVKGLSLDGIRWAFTSIAVANWHPLTWLTHLADSSPLFNRCHENGVLRQSQLSFLSKVFRSCSGARRSYSCSCPAPQT